MKIVFTQDELKWLSEHMDILLRLSAIHSGEMDEESKRLARVASKMRYKFSPNASYVWLSAKERQFLGFLAGSSSRALERVGSLGDELDVLKSITKKVEHADN